MGGRGTRGTRELLSQNSFLDQKHHRLGASGTRGTTFPKFSLNSKTPWTPKVIIYYIMGIPKPIIYHIVEVPKTHYLLYSGGTQNSLSTIQWGYPKVIIHYIMGYSKVIICYIIGVPKSHYPLHNGVLKSHYLLYNRATQKPLSTI